MLDLDLGTGAALIRKAREQDVIDKLYQQYTAQIPLMAFTGKVISWTEYLDHCTGADVDARPTADIMAELDDIERQFRDKHKREEAQQGGA